MKKRKWWLIILIIIILILVIRLITQEDDYICVDGDWVEHGVPNTEKPKGYCIDGKVDNFKECVAAGNPVMESYPRQCIHNNQTFIEIIENFCTGDIPDLCMTLYEPVCGYQPVQCVTAPCPLNSKTFTNSCFACQDPEVLYWMPGECV